MQFLLIQFIGAVGYASLIFSYFKKRKEEILFVQLIAYTLFAIHYYLLDGISGTICNVIGFLALLSIYIYEKYKWKSKELLVVVFIALLFVTNIFTFQNIFSIFPLIAASVSIASFLFDNENTIRIIGSISAACWLIYSVVYKSYVTIIFQFFTFTSIIIAFLKNKSKKKKLKD